MGFRRPESPLIDATHCYAAKPDNCCDRTSTRLVDAFTGCTKDGLGTGDEYREMVVRTHKMGLSVLIQVGGRLDF